MNLLNLMQEITWHYNRCLVNQDNEWKRSLFSLRAAYKDLQREQGISTLVLEPQSLVENEEFLRYVACRLDDVCDQMEVGEMYFAPSTMFVALDEYEHNHGVGLSEQGLSSLQRIALNRYTRDFITGDAYEALMKAVNAFGEYLLAVNLETEDKVYATSLKLIDTIRFALLRWMPEGFNLIDLTVEV